MSYLSQLKDFVKPLGKPELTYRARAEGSTWGDLELVVRNPIQKARTWAIQQNKPWPPAKFWEESESTEEKGESNEV
jgi:hypothetical protein